ncbi:MAG TPA: FAD-dependent oxidoreductase, partial [Candidatus Margulisiibacteriota bacterium]|nr:FAD-dependent oxidoreductase [Candidatus Margulisiibacteriota bacterium]
DREEQAGGIPRHAAHTGFGLRDMHRMLTGPQYAMRYVRLAADAGVELRTSTTVTDWIGPTTLSLTSPAGIVEVEAKAVVLATGCRERPRPARLVPGTRPLGVFTTGALQQFIYRQHQPVGRRAVVVGAEHVSFSAVLTLAHGGAATLAMVTEHARHQTYAPFTWLTATRLRVPILTSVRVTQILGRKRVEAVEVTDLRTGSARQLECDTVVFTGDWIPDHELARRGGLDMDPATRAPRVDCALRTSTRGVFAAGNLLHAAESADVAALSGRHVAQAIRVFLEADSWPANPPVPITCEPPLQWVSPSAISSGLQPPRGHFILRTSEFRTRAELIVTQGRRTLWRRRYRSLIPNRPIHAAAAFVSDIDANGPPVIFQLRQDQ